MNTAGNIMVGPAVALAAVALNFWVTQVADAAGFTDTGSLRDARAFPSATLLPNGKVLVAGGWNESQDALSSAELYNPSTGTWTMTGSLLATRVRHTATLLTNGQVLVTGGLPTGTGNPIASAELYDPATETWTQTGSMTIGRQLHTATLLINGQVLVTGGAATLTGNRLANAEIYDSATGKWTAIQSMSVARNLHRATLLPSGKVLVTGGASTGPIALSSAEVYDPTSQTWTPTGAMTTNRLWHSANLLANGQVLVAGGSSITYVVGLTNLATAELYDPAAGTWRATGALSGPRGYHQATLLPDGQVLLTGGFGWGSSLDSAEVYDPASGAWTNTGSMKIGRDSFTLTLLANGNALATAGRYYDEVGNPGPCLYSAQVYDSVGGPITLVKPVQQIGGAFEFAFTSTPLATNTVLTTTNPTLPLANWTVLGVVPEFAPGLYLFSDPQAESGPQRFYCVRSQ